MGKVLKPENNVSVSLVEAYAEIAGEQKLVAQMTGTMMTVTGREGISQ